MKVLHQFFKFSLVGVGNAIIFFLGYYVLLTLGWSYLLANFVAWVLSVAHAFFWNNRYVFPTGNACWKTVGKTYIAYGISFCVSTVLLTVSVELLGLSQYISVLFAAALSIPINFLLNKLWAFR